MSEYLDSLTKKVAENLLIREESIVNIKLEEKGFGHLIPRIKTSRFPKITIVRSNGWKYYYADDDSEDGKFIVAIKDFFMNLEGSANSISISFEWQDTHPLVEFKPAQKR